MRVYNIYKAVRDWAKTNGKEDLSLAEACDFGDSYGFLFDAENIYDNGYWCVRKKTYKPFMFLPVQNISKFKNRKIIPIKEVLR